MDALPRSACRILVIDNEPLIGAVLMRILRDHEVCFETCAKAALLRIQDGELFHRVICDIEMPGLGGADFFEGLLVVRPDMANKVVFITGGPVTRRSATFLASLDGPIVEKPFEPAALFAALALSSAECPRVH